MHHIATPLNTNLVIELDVLGGKPAGQLLNLRPISMTVVHCIGHHLRDGQAVEDGRQLIQHGSKIRPLLGQLSHFRQQLLHIHVRQRIDEREHMAMI